MPTDPMSSDQERERATVVKHGEKFTDEEQWIYNRGFEAGRAEASMLRNLLARIHGDGGHYLEQHGLEKALEDADSLVAEWRAAPPQPAKGAEPSEMDRINNAYRLGREDERAVALAGRQISDAARDVLAERQRQVECEGFTPAHDDFHKPSELAAAAGCYALFADAYPNRGEPPGEWPWERDWWKPKDFRRDMVRAAALLLAAIECNDRLLAEAQESKR